MRTITFAFVLLLSISLHAQIQTQAGRYVNLAATCSFLSNNTDFERGLSSNGVYSPGNMGYGFEFSVPFFFSSYRSSMTADFIYDYRGGNGNMSVQSLMLSMNFEGVLYQKGDYQFSIISGVGIMFNFFQLDYVENVGTSAIDSLHLSELNGVKFRQPLVSFFHLGFQNTYPINERLSVFQTLSARLYLGHQDYYYKNGGAINMSKYRANILSFNLGIRYFFY